MPEHGNPYEVARARMEAMLADPAAYFRQAWEEARREARAAIAQRKSRQFSNESPDQDPELSQDMGHIVATFWGPNDLRVDIDTRDGVPSDWLFEDEEAGDA